MITRALTICAAVMVGFKVGWDTAWRIVEDDYDPGSDTYDTCGTAYFDGVETHDQ